MIIDPIEREDAIRVIEALECFGYIECKTEALVKDINTIPSADRPQGEWIDISEWYAPRQKCSICETVVVGYGSNFCPNCGARMKGADDDLLQTTQEMVLERGNDL